ncbi:hypothetical protein M378DRAFT_160612 [Amanita muscaria Koide BX008]|uniref:Uncharacterized protein n=1 Tax=Amanita muscaria (strain Koide BX008) TaxID=946122 RepID=A0A0C2XCP2_AMAMK|nr:hypothetical protein M378DRAFT_160612 [Amanita muscaria Koide BX008]
MTEAISSTAARDVQRHVLIHFQTNDTLSRPSNGQMDTIAHRESEVSSKFDSDDFNTM